jgi:hypothetical protein
MSGYYIPKKTVIELATPASVGNRHNQIVRLALPLLAAGLSPEAVFTELRGNYAHDVTDREIQDVIRWASTRTKKRASVADYQCVKQRLNPKRPDELAIEWLKGFSCTEEDLWEASPWRPLENWEFDSLPLLAALWGKDEFINIVTKYYVEADGKVKPMGAGETLTRDEWLRFIREKCVPKSEAGAWIRLNPVQKQGSGSNGACTDQDVTSHRFMLLENDTLPLVLQLSVLGCLSLPIAAIIHSGGRSYHAWIKIDCPSEQTYRQTALKVLSRLERLGFDQSNKNPSRMSRLPGVLRGGVGQQKLIYLNPEPKSQPIF